MLDRCSLIGIAPTSTPEMTFPITSGGEFLVFLANLFELSMQRSGVTASNMEDSFVSRSIASAEIGL